MWIKICGITDPKDAVTAVEAGANAIGLNFFSGSKRWVSIEAAQEITRVIRSVAVPRPIDLVGVFVNSAPEEICQIAATVALNVVQLHGDESVADIAKVHEGSPQLHLIRALRISSDRRQDCFDQLRDLQNHIELFAVLLDAFVPGEFGGTGVTVDSQLVADYSAQNLPRLILAGGLTSDNVAETIAACRPWGIDTASGVESSPGIKSSEKINRFITEARRASAL